MSKNIVYYFTGTGNSLAVAKFIAGELSDSVMVSILCKDALKYIDAETERIGIVFPIYMNAVPKVVGQFIKTLKPMSTAYYFAVATNGGVPGMSGIHLNKILKSQGISLGGYFEIKMINNTPKGLAPKFLMTLDWELGITPDKVDVALRDAQVILHETIGIITDKKQTELQNIPKGLKRFNYWLMNILWYVSNRTKHRLEFILDDEACIGCGACSRICTSQRIAMIGQRPSWIHENCNFCYACFNYCPAQAIGVEHYTKKLGRYHHPDSSVEDIAKQIN